MNQNSGLKVLPHKNYPSIKPEDVAAAARFMFNLPHWPPQAGDDLDVPTLMLPSLQALELPNSNSLVHTAASRFTLGRARINIHPAAQRTLPHL